MKELTCPKCGTVITVDDASYAEILSQVKADAVREEVERRRGRGDATFAEVDGGTTEGGRHR